MFKDPRAVIFNLQEANYVLDTFSSECRFLEYLDEDLMDLSDEREWLAESPEPEFGFFSLNFTSNGDGFPEMPWIPTPEELGNWSP